jgi:hypothetical protein
VAEDDTLDATPSPAPPSWLANAMRQPLSLVQTLVGILAGLLTISGAFVSVMGLTSVSHTQGEVAALVLDARSRRPVGEAAIEVLTLGDALVTSTSVDANGRITRRLKEGRYRLRVSHPTFVTEVRQVEVHAGQRSEVPIALVPRPAPRVVRTVSEPGPVRKFFKDLGLP